MKNLLLFLSIISLVSSCSNLPKYTPALDKFVPGEEFRDSLLKSQIFQINPNTDTTVEGAEGTFIFIPEHAFVDANGNTVEGEIKLELAEALEPADMILANLPTLSNGKLLETGGMLYLKASADGKEVFPAKGKEPIVEQPEFQRFHSR